MNRSFATALACAVAVVAAAVVAAAPAGVGRDKTMAAQPKANSIAELAARYDSKPCLECHEEAHEQWARSNHAQSIFGRGRTAATFKTTVFNGLMEWPASGVKSPKDVKVEHLMGCAKCHLPQLADASDKVAQEILGTIDRWQAAIEDEDDDAADAAEATLQSLNIGCLVCHNRNAIVHKWTDGYPEKGVVYGVQDGTHDDKKFPRMARSPIMKESILCGQCHGQGPNLELDNPTQCATAYGSYLFAYVPEGGRKTCQECHMRESGLGHDMQSYRAEKFAKSAVDMHVEASPVFWRDNTTMRPKVAVRVELTNHAGHGVPDG
jgi:hypothetical protein